MGVIEILGDTLHVPIHFLAQIIRTLRCTVSVLTGVVCGVFYVAILYSTFETVPVIYDYFALFTSAFLCCQYV